MNMIARAVPLHDIADSEAYVRNAVNAAGSLLLTRDEREELVAEGLVILCELAIRYQPRMEGYERNGTFSGYAAKLLRLKLSDAYHRTRENHLCRTQPDGSRKIEYLPRAASYDQLMSGRAAKNADGVTGYKREDNLRHPGNFIPVPTSIAA